MKQNQQHEPASSDETTGAHSESLRILVVEDNTDQADSLAELLEVWGYRVAVAYDGLTGVEQARVFQPDVVVMDLGLPVLDGYQAARQMRADPATRQTRLIALTGYNQDEDRRKAHDAGFNLHMTKPADLEALHRALCSEGS